MGHRVINLVLPVYSVMYRFKVYFLLACLVVCYFLTRRVEDTVRSKCTQAYRGLKLIDELAAKGGYLAIHVELVTEDGYGLWLHRIGNNTGPPVLMHHAFMAAADSWLISGRRDSLVFLLLELGYDVWLSNQRGTIYNEFHLKYKRWQREYWDFSIYEVGYYDLPANIDKVLELRGVQQLYFISISLGTTMMLAMGSSRPEYNDKVRAAVLMSPVAYQAPIDQIPALTALLIKYSEDLYSWTQYFGAYKMQFRDFLLVKPLCYWTNCCLFITGHVVGEHRENMDLEEFVNMMSIYGAGVSYKMSLHLAQLFKSETFDYFDYGAEKNLQVYNKTKSPTFPLGLLTTPVAIFWGTNDPMITQASVTRLESSLPNLIVSQMLPDPLFTHIDPILGKNVNTVLYPEIINILGSFQRKNDSVFGACKH